MKPQRCSRAVHYAFTGPFRFDVERVLEKAKERGVISSYDDGRGGVPWFEGRPGPELRKLRDLFRRGRCS